MSSEHTPILTITTSKNWILPPRPKNTRKCKSAAEKKKPKQTAPASIGASIMVSSGKQNDQEQIKHAKKFSNPPSPLHMPGASALDSTESLTYGIKTIDKENYQLKAKLLSLIHDYKSLKSLVMSPAAAKPAPIPDLYDSATTARKRVFNEMGDPMTDLISDLNGLSYASPGAVVSPAQAEPEQVGGEVDFFNFVNLENDALEKLDDEIETELHDEDVDDEINSTTLSRSTSPSTSESEENSLMSSLTRSTTVSTTNSILEKKPFSSQFKFFELPHFFEEDYKLSFEDSESPEKKMSVIEEDHYNQVADFLEEKLMSNDVRYYVEKRST